MFGDLKVVVTCHSSCRTQTQTQDQRRLRKGLGWLRRRAGGLEPPLKGETTMNQQNAVEGQGSWPARRPHSAWHSPESSGSERHLRTAPLPEMPWICPDYFASDRVTLSRCKADSGQSQILRYLGVLFESSWLSWHPPVPLSACLQRPAGQQPACPHSGSRDTAAEALSRLDRQEAEAVGREPRASSVSP